MTAPLPIPGLPDTERRTAYSITSDNGPFAVNFAIYGDGTDFGNWVEVWLNGFIQNSSTYTLSSPSGPLGSIAQPITDAQITLNNSGTGTLEIVGARRPRRISQYAENRGVPARDLNQAVTDIIAQAREEWDRTRSRMMAVPAGETITQFPPAATRANTTFGFDASGNPIFNTLTVTGSVAVTTLTLTRAQIPTVTLAANSTIMVTGFTTAGDLGAGALYTNVGAGPTSPMAIQDLSGKWFGLVIDESVSIGWFGAVADGVLHADGSVTGGTDNTAAFGNFQAFALAQTVPVILTIPPGVYFISHSDGRGFYQGIPDLTVIAYGAVTSSLFSDFPTIVTGIRGTFMWRIQSTNVGDNSFTMLLANTGMSFTAGNLQCTNVQNYTGAGAAFAQSVNSNTAGKFYFEATINALTGQGSGFNGIGVGVSNGYGPTSGAVSSLPGHRSFMVFDDGTIWQQFVSQGTQVGSLGATLAANDVIGVAIDITNQLGWFRKNGGSWNGTGANPATGVGGLALSVFVPSSFGWQLLPAFVCTFIACNPGAVTHNFGGSGYAFAAPAGFGNWGGTLNTNYPVNIQPRDWVLISSCDAQTTNDNPPNWQFNEYHQVNTVNASTGVCTIFTPNMRYAHSATNPDNSITHNQFADHGGPATVSLFSPTSYPGIGGGVAGASPSGPNRGQPWNQTARFYGLTMAAGGQVGFGGAQMEFTDCTFNVLVAPSINLRAVFERCAFNAGTEIDKNITQIKFIDCNWGSSETGLSASTEMATFEGCSLHGMATQCKQMILRDCTVDGMTLGAVYAQNQTLQVENCNISSFGSAFNRPFLPFSSVQSFTAGVITILESNVGSVRAFTVPGLTARCDVGGDGGAPFTITGANNVRTGGILTATIAGGSAYTNGTYNYVPLTGGLGAQALANIVVSGGAVTSVTLINAGVHYSVSDVLTTAAANIGGTGSGFTYTVNSVSANDIVQIFTTLLALPTYAGTGPPVLAGFTLLPAPNVMFNNCIGNSTLMAVSQAQDGLPAFSYSFMEITGAMINAGTIPLNRLCGYLIKMRINVRKAYTGAQGSLALQVFGQSQAFVLAQSGNTWTNGPLNPTFDLKVAGERTITANRVSSLQPNDTDHALGGAPQPFGQMWFKEGNFGPFVTASIAADSIEKWPIVDVEIITDQAVGSYTNAGTIDYLQESGWHVVAATYTAQIGEKIAANTTGAAFTITLPPSPALGDFVKIYDAGNIFATNNLTIGRNGNNINSAAANFVANTNGAVLELVFISAAIGWRVFT